MFTPLTLPACACAARQPEVVEEIIHNLDYCDILVLGEELRPEEESLQVQGAALLGKHLDATNSTSGVSVYGRLPRQPSLHQRGYTPISDSLLAAAAAEDTLVFAYSETEGAFTPFMTTLSF